MLLLQCPHCKNRMKYQAMDSKDLDKKSKRCVYCGHSFSVRKNVVKVL